MWNLPPVLATRARWATAGTRVLRPARPNVPARDHHDPTYRTLVLTSIHDIDAARWDALAGNCAIARTHAYLAGIEASGIADCKYFYPVVFDARNELVAHACVYTITTDFAQLLPRRLQRAVRALRRYWPRLLCARITECATPLMVGNSLSIRDAALDIARSQRSAITVIRDFLPGERAVVAALQRRGFNVVSNMPVARIPVRWATYEDYLASMRARYRKDIKRRLQLARQGDETIETLERFGAIAETWAAQASVVRARSSAFKREALTAQYYREMDRRLGAQKRLLAVKRGERHVAHGMILLDDAHTIATFFGRDDGPPGREWFLLINEVIRIGIERGSRYIQLGLGSYHAKSLIGAELEPLSVCCRSRWEPLNWLMRRVPHIVAGEMRTPRRIFRSDGSCAGAGAAQCGYDLQQTADEGDSQAVQVEDGAQQDRIGQR
jgi:predicted N-acyltransferase